MHELQVAACNQLFLSVFQAWISTSKRSAPDLFPLTGLLMQCRLPSHLKNASVLSQNEPCGLGVTVLLFGDTQVESAWRLTCLNKPLREEKHSRALQTYVIWSCPHTGMSFQPEFNHSDSLCTHETTSRVPFDYAYLCISCQNRKLGKDFLWILTDSRLAFTEAVLASWIGPDWELLVSTAKTGPNIASETDKSCLKTGNTVLRRFFLLGLAPGTPEVKSGNRTTNCTFN